MTCICRMASMTGLDRLASEASLASMDKIAPDGAASTPLVVAADVVTVVPEAVEIEVARVVEVSASANPAIERSMASQDVSRSVSQDAWPI